MVRKFLMSIVTVLGVTGSAYAAELYVYPAYSHSYDADLNDLGKLDLNSLAGRNPTYYHQIDIYFTLTGQAANQSFQALVTNLVLGPGLHIAADYDSSTAAPAFWTNTSPPRSGQVLSTNADIGVDIHDLQAINAISDINAAYYTNPGEAAPQRIGSIYLSFDPGYTGTTFVKFDKIYGDSWSMWTNLTRGGGPAFAVNGGQKGESTGFIGGLWMPDFPEPSVISILGLGSVGLATRRRRV